MKNESIIELKEELKEIQKFFILGIVESEDDLNRKEYLDIYQISNSFRDFSFCSKWYISYRVSDFIIKNYNCFEDLVTCLVQDEMTNSLAKNNPKKNDNLLDSVFGDFHNKEETSKELSKEIIIQINNLLSKQNYIIIEEKNFNEKIKSIEKDLKIETIEYLQINDIPNYIKEKNKNDHKKNKIRTFFYYLIITYNKFQKYFEKIILLSAELGITFLNLIYIEKDNLLIPKSYIRDCKLIF